MRLLKVVHILPWSLDAIYTRKGSENKKIHTNFHNPIKEIYTYQSSHIDKILVIQFANRNKINIINKKKNNYNHLFFPQKFFKSKKFGWQISLSLLIYLIKEKPSIIHYHGVLGNRIYFLILTFVNRLLIKSILIGHHRGTQRFPKILNFITFIVLKLADFLIVQNQSIYQNLRKKYMIPHLKICVVPNGVSNTVFLPINKNDAKKLIGEKNDSTLLLWIGRLDKNKDPLKMLKIFKEVLNNSIDLKLIMIGDGILRNRVEKFIDQNSLKEKVLLESLQDQKNLSNFYSASDIFLSTSHQEGFSNVILEAMYHSLPIIAIKNKGNADLVSENNGILTSNNQLDIQQAIITLINDKEKMKNMSQNSKLIAETYDWDSLNNKIIKIYDDLILKY